jgi:hypothetical protein
MLRSERTKEMATIAVAVEPTQGQDFNFNYEELMALEITRPVEIIEGLICERQNVLLMGRFGVGKTMLGVQMSLCLATGRDFVGRKIPKAYRTAIIDCENDLGDVKNRLAKQHDGLGLGEPEDTLLRENWNYASAADPESELYGMKLDGGDFDSLSNYVRECSPEILIIDNLGFVVSRGDLKEPDEAKQFYGSLIALRKENESLRNGAIVIMHHLTKPGEALPTEQNNLLNAPYVFLSRARGSGRVLDFAQGRFAISEEQVGKHTYFVVNGINRSTSPVPLILQFNQDTLLFEQHEDRNFRLESVFNNRPKGREVYLALPEEFTWSEAERIIDTKTGKPFVKDTLNKTLDICRAEGFLGHDPETKRYRKLLR